VAGRNWKRTVATSLCHAMELCLEHAREKHNRSVDRIAELIGLANKYTLYKWVESGKLPAIQVRPFEHACGCDFVTKYLGHAAGKLVVDIPVGRVADPSDVNRVQESCVAAVGALIAFYDGKRTPEQTIAAVTVAMEDLAWHRLNAVKVAAPELDFDQ
jgi:hypothetical protein